MDSSMELIMWWKNKNSISQDRYSGDEVVDKLINIIETRHRIDEQTHGLTFGISKKNCEICKLLNKGFHV